MKQKKIMLLYKYYYDVYMLWRQMDKSNFTGMCLITFFAYTRFHPKSKLIIPLKYVMQNDGVYYLKRKVNVCYCFINF